MKLALSYKLLAVSQNFKAYCLKLIAAIIATLIWIALIFLTMIVGSIE